MKVLSIQLRFCCKLVLVAFFLAALTIEGQASAVHAEAAPSEQHLRSRLFIYDLRDGSSRLVYSADSIWEAPNWSPDGKYLIANSGGGIYKLALRPDGTVEPQKLAVPANFQCNNDKAISPDSEKIAFSATVPPHKGSQVFLADADGSNVKLVASESPSYFHGWSPNNTTLGFVAQRNGSGQYAFSACPPMEARRSSSPPIFTTMMGRTTRRTASGSTSTPIGLARKPSGVFPPMAQARTMRRPRWLRAMDSKTGSPTSRRTARRWCISAIPPVRQPTTRAMSKLS